MRYAIATIYFIIGVIGVCSIRKPQRVIYACKRHLKRVGAASLLLLFVVVAGVWTIYN